MSSSSAFTEWRVRLSSWLLRLLLSALSLVLAATIVELAVRTFMPVNLDFYNWQKIKRPSAFPGAGYEYIPGGRNDFYVGVPVRINSLALRDVELTVPKPPGVVRILGVGDSVTFGFGVPLENTYLKVLEAKLKAVAAANIRYEVVNAGMEGTGLDRHYAFLESVAPTLEPDLVIVALTMNDIADYRDRAQASDVRTYSSNSLLRRLNTALLFHSQAYLRSYLRVKTLLYQWGILDFDEEHWYEIDILKAPTDEIRQAWESSREILLKISQMARTRQWPMLLVMFPMEVQLDQQAVDHYQQELRLDISSEALRGEPQQELLRFGAAADVPVADLLPAFRTANQRDLYLRGKSMLSDPVHPSIAGHSVAGSALFAFLREDPSLSRALSLAPRGNGDAAMTRQ